MRAYRAWLEKAGILDGPVFRAVTRHGKMGDVALSSAAIAIVVKRSVMIAARAEGVTKADA